MNQLIRVTKNGVEQARFGYDALGRRVEKVAGGAATNYTYDGENILRDVRGTTTLTYIHGPEIDEPLAAEDDTVLTYFHADGTKYIGQFLNGKKHGRGRLVAATGEFRQQWEQGQKIGEEKAPVTTDRDPGAPPAGASTAVSQ